MTKTRRTFTDEFKREAVALLESSGRPLMQGHRQLGARSIAWRREGGYRLGMIPPTKPSYPGYRFPPEVIRHTIWLYFRFPLSLRMVEEMLAARGILVSHETVRQWARKFGQAFANQIRRRLPRGGDKWHLDGVVITIAGQKHWLWRAVDQDGIVLDVLVQSRRDKQAAKRLLRKLLKRQGQPPRVLITDKLASYPAAKKELMPGVEHRRHKGLVWGDLVSSCAFGLRHYLVWYEGVAADHPRELAIRGAGHRATSLYTVGLVRPEP